MSEEFAAPVPAGRERHTRRNVLLTVLAIFVVGVVVSGLFVFNLANSFDSKTQKIAQAFPSEATRPVKPAAGPAANAMNILLLGSDSRGAALQLAEEGQPSNQRSDTMLWVHIPADRKHIYMMSIMRDTWVDIPGYGDAKINAAMAYGGGCHWWYGHSKGCSRRGLTTWRSLTSRGSRSSPMPLAV